MLVTDGMEQDVNCAHPLKAEYSMVAMVAGIVADFSVLLFANTCALPIDTIS